MLRLETETGWWLVAHADHARLAGEFAAAWGNAQFRAPEPRVHVLKGIARHDDGWIVRDAQPQITRAGRPSAFSVELVGKYSAFEEIDLADYLAVRERAVGLLAEEDAYAAILVSMHTYNLLTARADRSTIRVAELPLLDAFLARQIALQKSLMMRIAAEGSLADDERSETRVREHFRLLQATDNLSLLACVDFRGPATLLHPLPLKDGGVAEVAVRSVGERSFVLAPYPFERDGLEFRFTARHVMGKSFTSADDLQRLYEKSSVEMLTVRVLAG